jgi:putative heme-binding domain-containing protein
MELEFTTPREKMNVVGVPPLQGKFEMHDAKLVAPGDPFRSVLLYRISKLGGGRMPLVGSSTVDRDAVDLFCRWIESLPSETGPSPLAEQRRQDEIAMASLQEAGGSPPAHEQHLGQLLSSTSGSMRLARAVDQQRLHPAVKDKAIATAAGHPNPVVRDLFERFVPEEKRMRRLGTSINVAELLAIPGDKARGRSMFFAGSTVNCQNCHQIEGKGRDVGPDLSHIGKKLDRSQLLENLIDPSKKIEEKYTAFTVVTSAGKAVTGILVARTNEAVTLKDAQANQVRISMADVETIQPQKKSLMPEQLLRDFTAQQAADLLAFLESLK